MAPQIAGIDLFHFLPSKTFTLNGSTFSTRLISDVLGAIFASLPGEEGSHCVRLEGHAGRKQIVY
jgi:hypothetical protein